MRVGKLEAWVRGYYEDKDELIIRLRRIEGQVRGLQRMVDEDAYCIDLLTQISAATSALKKVAVALLEDHLSHCVAEATKSPGSTDMVSEAVRAIDRLVKS